MITGSDVDEWPGRKGQGVERVGWSLDKEQETIDNISKPIKPNQLFSFNSLSFVKNSSNYKSHFAVTN